MDNKNNLLGMLLMFALLAAYLFYTGSNSKQIAAEKKKQDSIAKVNNLQKLDTNKANAAIVDTAKGKDSLPPIAAVATITKLENKDVVLEFSNIGAQPITSKLKQFSTATGVPQKELYVFSKGQNQFDFTYTTSDGRINHAAQQAFTAVQEGNSVTFTDANGLQIKYSLPAEGYMMDMKVIAGTNKDLGLNWKATAPNTEYDKKIELQYTTVAYKLEKESVDKINLASEEKESFETPLQWMSFKQHYFNTLLIAENAPFKDVKIEGKPTDSATTTAAINASFKIPADATNFKLYTGPNDYKILKSYKKDYEEIIPLGYGIITFVKYINKWIIIPIFDFLAKFISNYGILIALLTLIVRLLMAPITYKSYVSAAKMKLLKPDIDALKEKYADDQQTFGLKQMELFKSTGVSPLGGCLPALAQLPIFFALLQFFPNAIDLRGKSFLWTKDLSTSDSIYHFGNIPIISSIYGDHISLWTILFVVTSLILALQSMSNATADQNNPMLKYMPFIMPVIFLGIFNKLPASLTLYYFVSNLITIILQWVIQNYIIDHDKLHAKIQENKKAGPKPNKLMEKMAEIQRQKEAAAKKK